jgi:hypothetical protein
VFSSRVFLVWLLFILHVNLLALKILPGRNVEVLGDFLCIDERRVGILVADVTGHGVPAALIAAMRKIALAGQEEHAHDPALVLTGLNRSLCGKFDAHFVTAA